MLRLQEAHKLLDLCHHYNAILIINDDLELAANINAHGLHLGKDDRHINEARAELGPEAIIGVSCYNELLLAEKAEQQGADYIAFGSFFPSPTKPAAIPANIDLLKTWKHHATPACAIGGITVNSAPTLIEAGADMLAVISDLWDSKNIQKHTRAYTLLWSR
jgi:thiamine-phosphate pyrophosphorylase